MQNPVKLVSSREVHQGNLVYLREDRVVLPRGTQAVYEFVEIKHGASVLRHGGERGCLAGSRMEIRDRPAVAGGGERRNRARRGTDGNGAPGTPRRAW
ncbi:MAG: hypothetical protein WDO73_28105 [Ignavibacteriota bacterium]